MSTLTASKNLKMRYRVGYVLGWAAIMLCMFAMYYSSKESVVYQLESAVVITSVSMPAFYVMAYVLVPKLLYRKKIFLFVLSIIATVIGFDITGWIFCRIIYHLVTGGPAIPSLSTSMQLFNIIMWDNFIAISLAAALKIISDRFRMEKKLHAVEREKITTELNFLRSQVNPHFLFNVMNTIYFQIEKKNTDARLSVEKFAEMLRYQLYECTTDKIQIDKELHYIRNYVAIQTLRMEKGSDISLFIDQELDDFMIAPLLILPIVENAFKHVSNFKEPGRNKIHLTVKNHDKNTLLIEAINTYDQSNGQTHLLQTGGLGI